MSIKSIKINNLLSYDNLFISEIKDINCVIGRNNTGKSNLLKILRFFYDKLEKKDSIPPKLNNNYSSHGYISITYDTSRISKIVRSHKNNENKFFKQISNTLLKENYYERLSFFLKKSSDEKTFTLTLTINSDDSLKWSTNDKNTLNIVNHLFPYFDIETRHVDLYDWDKLWHLISKLKSFNTDKISNEEIINFFDSKIGENSKSYSDYITKIKEITKTSKYAYKEKVLNYVKVGLDGQTFNIDGKKLEMQSDGTNSFKYIEIFLSLLISLTRRDYITPIVFIDEPEIGLHPKNSELLIENLFNVYSSFKKTKSGIEPGKYSTPYPNIFITTHSPNILKSIIKSFGINQQVLQLSLSNGNSHIRRMNSIYDDSRFLNIFNDNEARLFFSEFIFFVEGATELELFSNKSLIKRFQFLKNIDIYMTSDLALKFINPSFSNTSIPYLVLYDADHLFSYDNNNKKMILKTSKISISKIRNSYKFSYFGSINYQAKKTVDSLLEFINKTKIQTDCNNVKITGYDHSTFISFVNKFILSKENYWITTTTIEACLINETSLHLFKQWILTEVIENLNPADDININRIINSYSPASLTSKSKILNACNKLLKNKLKNEMIDNKNKLFIKKLKREFINSLKIDFNSKFNDLTSETIAIRLIFCGKSETLTATYNKDYRSIVPVSFSQDITSIKKDYALLSHLTDKTSGWVSKFLNFSIKKIEKNSKSNKEFYENFKLIFPELNAILERLRFR